MKRFLGLALSTACLSVFVLSSCVMSDPYSPVMNECVYDQDCPAGWYCRAGVCAVFNR